MNEEKIWHFIYDKCQNAYGTAALMGNLMAESSLNPAAGAKDSNYIFNADNGSIDFVHDKRAFGLVQWCYYTRKQGLLDYAKSEGMSVGSLDVQLEYMWKELQSYKAAYSAIMNAENIREASDIIMLKYEKPFNTGEAARKRRAEFGQKFYNTYTSSKPADEVQENKANSSINKVLVTTDRVNIRNGNSLKFSRVSQANKNDMFEWVATAENGWHAIKLPSQVAWISGEYTRLIK